MNLLDFDNLIALIAPHRCLGCSLSGRLICESCAETSLLDVESRCYRCHASTSQFAVCARCRGSVSLRHVWVSALYKDLAKQFIEKMKFERAKAACKNAAEIIAKDLPLLPAATVVCHVPTTAHRRRVRGYDQSERIAKHLAKTLGLEFRPLLIRTGNSRQLGSSRKDRIKQASEAFAISAKYDRRIEKVLLIDDVTTSGATIEAAANLMRRAGVKSVDAAVFAQAVE